MPFARSPRAGRGSDLAWQRYFGMDSATANRFRDAVIEALDGRTLTREE